MPWIGSGARESRSIPHQYRSSRVQTLCFACTFSPSVLLPSTIYATVAAPTAAWVSSRTRRATELPSSLHPALLVLPELTINVSGLSARKMSLSRMSGKDVVEGGALPSTTTTSADLGAAGKSMSGKGAFPTVTMDADAVQKFAEIEVPWVEDGDAEKPSILIRGMESAGFHKDAARPTMQLLREAGEHPTISGGGRIKHDSRSRSIFIYGYSMEFGHANLACVAELCREAYPDYEVTWSEGGY